MSRVTYTIYHRSAEADERIKDRSVLVIDNEMAQDLLSMEDSLSALEETFKDEGTGAAASGTKTCFHIPTSEPGAWHQYISMEGGIRKWGVVALRIRSNVHWHQEVYGQTRLDYYAGTLDQYGGLILLFSADDGALRAIMNDGHIQHMRVGATCGLSAKYMARPDARVLGILGSGGMAMTHAWGMAKVRDLSLIKVYSPNRAHREAFARQVQQDLNVETVPLETPEDVVRDSDIVSTCTSSHQPVLFGRWLQPGMHITTNTEYELDDEALCRIGRYAIYRSGTTEHAFTTPEDWRPPSLGGITADTIGREQRLVGPGKTHVLSDILLGHVPGRATPAEITCLASGGAGAQFAALAHIVHLRARERGMGNLLPLSWFLQHIRS